MTWICDQCYSAMKVISEGRNRNRVYCPKCGTEWLVDDDDQYIDEDDGIEEDGECLDVTEAAQIWMCNGMDEDYMFGYTEEELRNAL